jgi:MHS family dicarboxylic acid transporter PcaT-like MFS transporter
MRPLNTPAATNPVSMIGAPAAAPHYSFEEKRKRVFSIVAASSGNLVEWFDFYV